jgi:hypothetical protein
VLLDEKTAALNATQLQARALQVAYVLTVSAPLMHLRLW